MRKSIRLAAALPLIAVLVVGLMGCAKKPPECADSDASKSLRRFMDDAVVEVARAVAGGSEDTIRSYLATWKFDLSNVTSGGYDDKSRTRTCRGKVAIEIPETKQNGSVEFEYSMQTLEDTKSGDFQLKVSRNYQNWARSAATPAIKHFRDLQTAGTWTGTSKCGPTELRSESLAPFPADGVGYTIVSAAGNWVPDGAPGVPIELVVADGKAEMRMAADGRTITRTATLSQTGGLLFPSKDEFESLVPDQGSIRDGRFLQPNAETPNVGVRAQVKSNSSGAVMNAVLVRTCVLELTKK